MITTCLSGVHDRRNEHLANTIYPDNVTALCAKLSQEDALDGESSSIANQQYISNQKIQTACPYSRVSRSMGQAVFFTLNDG